MVELSDISNTPSEKLIEQTLETFQPFYEQELTNSDALEIIESLASASEILLEIAEELETDLPTNLEKVIQK